MGMEAGVGGWLGCTGVTIPLKTGSGSPTCSLKLDGGDGGPEVRSMRAGSGTVLDPALSAPLPQEPLTNVSLRSVVDLNRSSHLNVVSVGLSERAAVHLGTGVLPAMPSFPAPWG